MSKKSLPPPPIRTPIAGQTVDPNWARWFNELSPAISDATGQLGLQGVTGLPGSAGAAGADGAQGDTGVPGIQGIQGATGVFGQELVANIIPLGLPTDGTFSDGFFDFTETTMATDSIDELNEIMGAIAPAAPGNLSGSLTLANTTAFTAILPTGLPAAWYTSDKTAGDTVTDYVVDNTYNLLSPSQSSMFKSGTLSSGDVGTVSNLINAVTDATRLLTDGTGTTGNLQVTTLADYSSIWRICNAQINYTQTTEGYVAHRLKYAVSGASDQSTADTGIRYDGSNPTPVISATAATENTLSSSRFLSGIQYYYIGDTFDMTASVAGIANRAIRPTNPISYSMPGLTSVNKTINGSSFAYDQTYELADTGVALNAANVYDINARLTVIGTKPNGSLTGSTGATTNALVNTYPTTSTNCNIYMIDEYYRMPLFVDFSLILPITGLWTSSDPLVNGDGQLYNNGWVYPSINFESGYLPAQQSGTNYSSGFSGNQSVAWGCNIGVAHSSCTITFTGMNYTSISPYTTGDLNVMIRLPTETVWLDCGRSFGDGIGCRNDLGSSGSVLACTFGTASSTGSTGVMYIAVIMRTASAATASKLTIVGT